MKFKLFFYIVSIFLIFISCNDTNQKNAHEKEVHKKPNVIYILADDLGYAEIGSYGQSKIETPNIDKLAQNGMLFTQFYASAPVCAPSRYMLLSGKHSGHSYIRGNDGWKERGDVGNYIAVEKDSTLEGQYPIPANTVLIPKKFKEIGYRTGMVGKWGLGAPQSAAIPTKMGFDFFYGYNDQSQAHTYYPLHLYKNENRVHLNNDTVAPHTLLDKGADPYDLKSYEKYTLNEYSPDLMFNAMSNFISENKDKPFFFYWATPLPHVALQAPKKWVDYYHKKFGEEEPYLGQAGYFPVRYPRATYAAMVSYLDENIGRLIDQLKSDGIYENTLIIFTSDNGPTYNGGSDSSWFDSAKPFKSEYGHGKGFVHEGGLRVPMIASWPGHIAKGTKTNLQAIQYDVMATLGDVAGFKPPSDTDGISFLPTLLGDTKHQKTHDFLYWEYPEYGGQVAIRMGKWKVIRKNLNSKKQPTTELYNMEEDSLETINLAKQHPTILEKAAEIFKREHQNAEREFFRIPSIENGLFPTTN